MNLEKLEKNVKLRGFDFFHAATAEEAVQHVLEQVQNTSVGIGGSTTVDQIGLYDRLKENNEVHWHWKNEDQNAERKASALADVYLTSVQALAETGEMVSIDGTGNRVAGMLYGHKKVYYLVGTNKLVPTLQDALVRAREVGGPARAKQLNRKTPCVVDGKCHDCRSPERICNGMNIMLMPMGGMPAEVLLIDQELGI